MKIYDERIQEFRTAIWTIRVWREMADGDTPGTQDDDLSFVISEDLKGPYYNMLALAGKLLKVERVNAVEVKDKAGNGCVRYASEEVEINHRRFTII